MKYAPQAVIDFLNANNVSWRADLYTLTLVDGTKYYWTTCDGNLLVGGHTFLANGAVLSRSNLRQTARLEIDTLDVSLSGLVTLGGKTIFLMAVQGVFDEARLQIDRIVGAYPGDISLGVIPAAFEGQVATIEPSVLEVKMTVQSELANLNQNLPKAMYQPSCNNAIFDANCTLSKVGYTKPGLVSSATTTTINVGVSQASIMPNGWFDLGVLTFTSGALSGVRASVKAGGWVSPTLTLNRPLPQAPQAGDTFNIYPGCGRTKEACHNKFGNQVNYRGFIHIPAPEASE